MNPITLIQEVKDQFLCNAGKRVAVARFYWVEGNSKSSKGVDEEERR